MLQVRALHSLCAGRGAQAWGRDAPSLAFISTTEQELHPESELGNSKDKEEFLCQVSAISTVYASKERMFHERGPFLDHV